MIDPRIIKALRELSDRIDNKIYDEVKAEGHLVCMISREESNNNAWEDTKKILEE
jgi:hypothetical protein